MKTDGNPRYQYFRVFVPVRRKAHPNTSPLYFHEHTHAHKCFSETRGGDDASYALYEVCTQRAVAALQAKHASPGRCACPAPRARGAFLEPVRAGIGAGAPAIGNRGTSAHARFFRLYRIPGTTVPGIAKRWLRTPAYINSQPTARSPFVVVLSSKMLS